MKILAASIDALPQIGGVSLMTHHLSNALVAEGAQVDLIAPAGSHVPDSFENAYTLIEDQQSDTRICEGSDWTDGERSRLTTLFQGLASERGYDRCLAFHPTYYGQALRHFCAARKVSLSVFVHGFEVNSLLSPHQLWLDMRYRIAGIRPTFRQDLLQLIRKCDEVIVNSAYTEKIVRRAGRRATVEVIGCGIQRHELEREIALDEPFRKDRMRSRSELGLDPNVPCVGTVSRLVPQKNIEMLIRALAGLPDVKALIVGDGPDQRRLKQIAFDLGVANRIVWAGAVEEIEKWRWMRAMDAFCLLSKQGSKGEVEGFGIALLEAGAAGTPVVASRSGGMVSVVRDEETGLTVDVDDDQALVSSLRHLLASSGPAERYVMNARRQIAERYNWTSIAQSLIQQWRAPANVSDGRR